MGISSSRGGGMGQPMQRPNGWKPQGFGDMMSMVASQRLGRPVGAYGRALESGGQQQSQPKMGQQPMQPQYGTDEQVQRYMQYQMQQRAQMQQPGGQPMLAHGRSVFGGRY